MMIVPQSFIQSLTLAVSLLSSTVWASTFVVHEKRDSAPSGFIHLGSAPDDKMLNMRINLAMGNQVGLEAALEQASSPTSPTFREWLTKEQVESFAAPTTETGEAVTKWLASFNITSIPATPAGDWIKFTIPVKVANQLLNTEYSLFNHTQSGQTSVRTLQYSIPSDLQPHVKAVHPTTSFNGPLRGRAPITAVSATNFTPSLGERATVDCNATITPACLQTLYGIPTQMVSSSTKSKIGVAGYTPQNADSEDLSTFLKEFRPDLPSTLNFITELYDGATNVQDGTQAGLEANLDTQYTVGLVNGIPTVYEDIGYTVQDGPDDGYLDSINYLISQTSPPLVFSTSYGFDEESALSLSLTVAYCNAIMQLASRGVSVTFASGDGGVASSPDLQCEGTPFPPTFPTCPYATLVGATQNVPEIGAGLTAGGTVSAITSLSKLGPPFLKIEADAVNAYIAKIGDTYAGLYNASGRAYPDVSAQGGTVEIIINGHVDYVGGTSCSSPIFSSVIALLNDELLSAGKSPLGFLNPWIYANPQAFNDITIGNNPGCGTEGFSAYEGWDPVTGMGSPNYAAMRTAAGL
ncbi:family S53 protease [Lentinula lateritia]|uniref:Family S53 protease n=1 Tax=Lentinula lateritia TaxID=40482 RepID=A0ABQ8VAV3_9AGAR|nr:family S53 protease [Lentinula lateritia]